MPSGVYARTVKRGGWKWSKETREKLLGRVPANFKGDGARYETKHQWVYYHFGKATHCENPNCKYKNPKRYHWANISGKHLRNIKDWIQLCPSCHKRMDWKPKMICRNGHKLENNFLVNNRGSRICKTCTKITAHKNYLKHRKQIIERITERRRFLRSTIKIYNKPNEK